jgi:hypothetical protein
MLKKKKVVRSNGHADSVLSSCEAQDREFKGFKVGVEPPLWDAMTQPARVVHGTSSSPRPCRNGSLDHGPGTRREHASNEGSEHSSNGTPCAASNGISHHNQVCCSPKVLKVLGADENEGGKILTYIKEHGANERWTSSSDSETSERSTSGSPRGERLATEQPLFYSKSAAPQAFLGTAVMPEGRDSCSQIGGISIGNRSTHLCSNGESYSVPLDIYL